METLDQLMYWRGIAPNYFNYKGEHVDVSLSNRTLLLEAMGFDLNDHGAINRSVHSLEVEPWTQWVGALQVTPEGDQSYFEVNIHPSELNSTLEYEILLENGCPLSASSNNSLSNPRLDDQGEGSIANSLKGCFTPALSPETGDYVADGIRYSRRRILCGSLPMGYHKLAVSHVDTRLECCLVAVPSQGHVPTSLEQGEKVWGFIVQLYTLRTQSNWGIGDLDDLKQLIRHAASSGVGVIGLNPLHVLCTPNEYHCSPYSPSDRRFIEPLYIAIEHVLEYALTDKADSNVLDALKQADKVDYQGVWKAKFKSFRAMFKVFEQSDLATVEARRQKFQRYKKAAGQALQDYCYYQAMRNAGLDYEGCPKDSVLTPEQKQDVEFYAYLQWIAQDQLASCQKLAEKLGMTIGLMRDLAVGADGSGSEVSTNSTIFCKQASVGAPPDPLAEKGQNWGLPPMDPANLQQTDFAHFVSLLRSNMQDCGALRIDHAMSLMRLWWCPPGQTADFGAYIYYPFETMLGLLKLESQRNNCMIIGEDMGVVPDAFRDAIIDASVFTNKLFYFEREHDNRFKLPEHYMPKALAMLTNHDVPTLASWWSTSDLTLRQELNLLDEATPFEQTLEERRQDKHRLLDWLQACGESLESDKDTLVNSPLTEGLLAKIMCAGAKINSQVFAIQLDDLALIDLPVNVPGTSSEYDNWQRKLTVDLDTLFSNSAITRILSSIHDMRAK